MPLLGGGGGGGGVSSERRAPRRERRDTDRRIGGERGLGAGVELQAEPRLRGVPALPARARLRVEHPRGNKPKHMRHVINGLGNRPVGLWVDSWGTRSGLM